MNTPSTAVSKSSPEALTGYKFEHILISVVVAHTRDIGQFDDTCARHIEKGMKGYHGVLMVDAQAQYRHCTEEQHVGDCACGLCHQVRRAVAETPHTAP